MDVTFTREEHLFIREAGHDRYEANADRSDIADYDKKRFRLTDRQAEVLGVAAEAAWFKYLGGNVVDHPLLEWAHFVPPSSGYYDALLKRQDLYNTYEVRRADKPSNPIPVRAKDKNIVLSAWVDYLHGRHDVVFDRVVLLGWAYVTDQGTVPAWAAAKGHKKTKVISTKRPVQDLLQATRGYTAADFVWT